MFNTRRGTRLSAIAALTMTLLAMSATAALAHAGFVQASVPAESTQSLNLRVPNERTGEGNARIEIAIPTGFTEVSCAAPALWSCSVDEAGTRTVITYDDMTGNAVSGATVVFDFEVTTPSKQGSYAFPTIQTYTSGEEVAWIQLEEGADRPAPKLQVGDSNEPVTEASESPKTDHPDPSEEPRSSPTASPTASPSASATPVPTDNPTPTESVTPDASDSSTPDDQSTPDEETGVPTTDVPDDTDTSTAASGPDSDGGDPATVAPPVDEGESGSGWLSWLVAGALIGGLAGGGVWLARRRKD